MLKQIKKLYKYRQMIFSLVKKELRGRYKASVLGFLWTFINPLLQLGVYTLVFSIIMKNGIEKYYLFLFVALVPWIFFSSSLTGGATSIIASKDLLKKIYFPREVLPIAYITSSFVNMLFSFIVIFLVLILSGIEINFIALLFLPLIMLIEYILALGIVLITSSLTVYFRDLEHILNILAMAWQFLTPIMYSKEMVPEKLIPIWNLNPMTPIITAYRDILYYGNIPQLTTLIHAVILGFIFVIIGFVTFNKLQKNFAEEL